MTTDLKVAIAALVAALVFVAGVTAAGRQLRHSSELSVEPVALGTPAVENSSPTNAEAPARSPAGIRSDTSRAHIRSAPQSTLTTPPSPPPAPSMPAPASSPALPQDGTAAVQGTVPPPTVPVDRAVYTSHTDDYRGDDGGDQQDPHEEEK